MTSAVTTIPALRFIADQPAWYGRRSGYYAQLPRAFRTLGHHVGTTTPCDGVAWRAAGKAWATVFGLPPRRQTLTIDELRFHAGWMPRAGAIGVILAIEHHLPSLSYWRKAPRRLIGTLHHPRAFWSRDDLDGLKRLASAIVLYRSDIDFFAAVIGADRVRFAYHGVDTDFFTPSAVGTRGSQRPLLLCVGQFGRDFAQLARIAPVILDRLPDAELQIVVAQFARDALLDSSLERHPRVHVSSGISDEQLRHLYQRATLLLLPMNEAGANNAIVEALASGLPILTTDVGGIRDYGGGTLFPLVGAGDDAALIDEAVRLVHSDAQRLAIADRSRRFAVANLAWPLVAADHWQVYRELAA